MMAQIVLIPQDVATEGKEYLTERGYEIRMGKGYTPGDLVRDIPGCQGVLARTAEYPAEVLEAGTDLRVIARHGVGVDNVDVGRATELGIWVTNAPESLSATVAEHTLGLMISVARNFGRCERALRRGEWEVRTELQGVDLEGKTLGIVGLGRIGRALATKASVGLGMHLLCYDPYVEASGIEGATMVPDIEILFGAADFVSLHLPATPETAGLVDRDLLGRMKPTAYLINAARGSVVVTQDLLDALRQERIAGAALDVYEEEPLPAGCPLFELENVALTPHIASATKECMVRMALHAAMGIHEVLSDRVPRWGVNTPAEAR